ncbi:hypothetical protein FIBSPDRAFT_874112 [Athelia psychrophila]|uniref:Uncharacterized protein n=1 Tax=Athelia psychrophila TaxID=1759441 RepID=A0A165XSN3_9AGAM|nr:hypothetical protein FIBSPDRAFT_874112 [Fibularhizoctonia sp. CBS 109695]
MGDTVSQQAVYDGPTEVPEKKVGGVSEGALEVGNDGDGVFRVVNEGLLFERAACIVVASGVVG